MRVSVASLRRVVKLRCHPRACTLRLSRSLPSVRSPVASFGSCSSVKLYEMALSDRGRRSSLHHVVTNPGYSGRRRGHYGRPDERVERP